MHLNLKNKKNSLIVMFLLSVRHCGQHTILHERGTSSSSSGGTTTKVLPDSPIIPSSQEMVEKIQQA